MPSERTTTRSRSSPWEARPRPDRAVGLVRLDRREGSRDLRLDDALPLEAVEPDPEALERGLDLLQHPRNRIAGLLGEDGDIPSAVAVLGRLLPAPDRIHRRAEEVHLASGVVVVVLALDLVAGELEQSRDRVTVGPVSGRGDRDRPGRVRRDELHLDPLARVGGSAAETPSAGEHRREPGPEPGVVDGDVQEARARDVHGGDPVQCGDPPAQLLGDLARRLPTLAREAERHVRRVVAVARVCRALELDGRPRHVGKRARQRVRRVALLHHRIVRPAGTEYPGTARRHHAGRRTASRPTEATSARRGLRVSSMWVAYSTAATAGARVVVAVRAVIPSRARAVATSSRAL